MTQRNSAETSSDKPASGFSLSRYSWGSGVFLLALLVSLIQTQILLHPEQSLFSDMAMYISWAERIAAGGAEQTLDYFYPAGTSIIFAAFFYLFPKFWALKLISVLLCLLTAASAVLIGRTAALLFNNETLGKRSAYLAAFFWPFAAAASFYLSETLFIFFFLTGQYLFLRALESKNSSQAVFSALALALASVVRTNGLGFLLLCFFVFVFLRRVKQACFFLSAAALLLAPFVYRNATKALYPVYSLAANDAYNIYLGQSRREAVGVIDPETKEFYIFANNNARVPYLFKPHEVLSSSILDRQKFFTLSRQLWQHSVPSQLLATIENIVELYIIRPMWPLENYPAFLKLDLFFQLLQSTLGYFAGLYLLFLCLLKRQHVQASVILLLPIVALSLTAGLSTGQSRYLLPGLYNLLPATAFLLSNRLLRPVFCLSLLAYLGLLAGGFFFVNFYARELKPLTEVSQEDYFTLASLTPQPAAGSKVCLVELGRSAGESLSANCEGAEVEAENPVVLTYPERVVSWAWGFKEETSIQIRCPSGMERVGIYLTDADGFQRISLLKYGAQEKPAFNLHNGRWYGFPLSTEALQIIPLNGASANISAVACYTANKGAIVGDETPSQ